MDDFNRIIADVTEWYGEDKIVFFKVDGEGVFELMRAFNVQAFPYIIAIGPDSRGAPLSMFDAYPRNYDNFKKWITGFMGEIPVKKG